MPILIIVLFCHFLTAFTALGMPLFMPRMLNSLTTENSDYLVGIMFVVPVLCSALSAPWWGRFADKYGKKRSLLRSQLGLTSGFLMSGFADTLTLFSLGLIVQGISGGTLAASNAYLSSMYKGRSLAKSLNLTQFSARLALVSAPLLLGFFTEIEQPLLVYRYLALLPCTALIISLFLPKDEDVIDAVIKPTNKSSKNTVFSQLLYLQFLFCFAMVVTFPYFLPYVQSLGDVRDTMAGFYYSFPHFVYLLLAFFLAKLTLSAHLQSLSGHQRPGSMNRFRAFACVVTICTISFGMTCSANTPWNDSVCYQAPSFPGPAVFSRHSRIVVRSQATTICCTCRHATHMGPASF